MWRCTRCRLAFLDPAPQGAELAACYPTHYWWQTQRLRGGTAVWHRLLEAYRRFMVGEHVRRIRRLAASSPHPLPRWLDVGCGDGLLLDACHELPVARVGLDPSVAALRPARRRRGATVLQGALEELPFADSSFTIVTATDVLEHVSSPRSCLGELRRVLEPGGWLAAQVPNAASLQCRLLGLRWAGFDVPRHLITFSTHNLIPVLESSGFRVARVSHLSLRDNPAAIVMSVFPRLFPPARRVDQGRQNRIGYWANSLLDLAYLLLVVAATPLAFFESLLRQGGTIVVEAQKK